jgi:hypothetical protein
MKTQLSIPIEMDAIFQRTVLELNCAAVCIQEETDSNRYEIEYNFIHDLFYLGIQIGMKRTHEIFTK